MGPVLVDEQFVCCLLCHRFCILCITYVLISLNSGQPQPQLSSSNWRAVVRQSDSHQTLSNSASDSCPRLSTYRVSGYALFFLIWLWQIEIFKLNLVWGWFGNSEYWQFDLWPINLVKSNIPVLHSLQEEGCQKSIKKWIFDGPSHINRLG